MRDILEPVDGLDVRLTRDDDSFLGLSQRAELANAAGADYFLSVHFNSASNRSARGHEVFTSPGQTNADPFATALFRAYEARFPDIPARKAMRDGDPDKEAKFTVLVATDMPAALYECEFISNAEGEAMIGAPQQRQAMAEALAFGFLSHSGLTIPATPTPEPAPPTTGELDQESILADLDEIDRRTSAIRRTVSA